MISVFCLYIIIYCHIIIKPKLSEITSDTHQFHYIPKHHLYYNHNS